MKIFSVFLKSRAGDEDGFVLVTSLLLLVVLTLIGISSIRTTTFEVMVSGNDRVTKLNFYQAEGAAKKGAQILYDRDPEVNKDLLLPDYNILADDPDGLLDNPDKKEPFDDVLNLDDDGDEAITMDDFIPAGNSYDLDNNFERSKVVILPAENTSLKVGQSRMYSYGAYGVSNAEKGFALIQIGFKKRF